MLIVRAVIAAGLLAGLASCSTVIEGKSQELTINSIPAGADCAVTRKGVVVGRVASTPGTVTIEKNSHDLNIVCHKTGYETAGFYNESDIAAATFASVLLTPPLAVASTGYDMSNGAGHKYTSEVTVVLPPLKVRTP